MKRERVQDLLSQGPEALGGRLTARQAEVDEARFSHAAGQLRQTHRIKHLRRQLARVHTAISQSQAAVEGGRA